MIKTYNIIASFSDGLLLRGAVMALDEKSAWDQFEKSPEVQRTINVDHNKLMQYSIYEAESN